MPIEQDAPAVTARVEQLLVAGRTRGVHLRLTGRRFDDGWLYLVVEPERGGERASQHAHYMTEIERTLEREGSAQALLVPAVPEPAGPVDVQPPLH